MLVDPYTGLPIPDAVDYDPASITGALGIGALNEMGYEQGTLMGALSDLPGATTTMAWNMRRGGNTIIYGGWDDIPRGPGRIGRFAASMRARRGGAPGSIGRTALGPTPLPPTPPPGYRPRGTFANHLRRRSFGRFANVANVDNFNMDRNAPGGHYSPFQFLGREGNKFLNWAGRTNTTVGNFLANRGFNGVTNAAGQQQYLSGGVLSRLNASSRIARGKYDDFAQLTKSLRTLDPKLGRIVASAQDAGMVFTDKQMSTFVSASMQGTISQRFSGYMKGAFQGAMDMTERTGLEAAEKSSYMIGREAAVRHLAGGNLSVNAAGNLIFREAGEEAVEKVGIRAAAAGLRFAVKEGGVLAGSRVALGLGARAAMFTNPVTGAIGTALLVADAAKIGMHLMTGMLNTTREAITSMKGSIDKPIMGMGYRDNTVAATSRARGVMAIQNSRLNARSILGSESALMAAHFG